MNQFFATALVLAANSGYALADLSTIKNMPLPSGAALQIVGVDIEQNGSRVSIADFQSRDELDRVLAFYQRTWPAVENHPGHVYQQVNEWSIIARLDDGINLALQLKPNGKGGTAGVVSALDVDSAGSYRLDPPPMPPGASVLSSTGTEDGTRRAHTWMLHAGGRPSETAMFYRDRMPEDDWKVVLDRSGENPAVVMFSGESGTLEIVATSGSDGTFVLVNQVETGL